MRLLTLIILLTVIFLNCSTKDNRGDANKAASSNPVQKPDDIEEITEITPDSNRSPFLLKFSREKSFGSTDDVLIGVITTFTTDDLNRVFIADRDQTTIHVFHEDGRYIRPLGKQGRGPGEFMRINPSTQINIFSEQMYVSGTEGRFTEKIHVFSLKDLSFSHTVILREEDIKRFDENLSNYYPHRLYPLRNEKFLVGYEHIRSPEYFERGENVIKYFIQDKRGKILAGPILEQTDHSYLYHKTPGNRYFANAFSYLSKPLLSVSKDDHIYSAQTKNFQIQILNSDSKLINRIDYSGRNISLTQNDLKKSVEDCNKKFDDGICLQMIRDAGDLPETWPAIENMLIDDENRLWIATIVEDFDIYEWWVLRETGEVITKFEWPRDKPIKVIRNSAVYTRESDPETGLQQVVRYGFELVER